jgi:hypothetical protein
MLMIALVHMLKSFPLVGLGGVRQPHLLSLKFEVWLKTSLCRVADDVDLDQIATHINYKIPSSSVNLYKKF